jgi:hypothetical protein
MIPATIVAAKSNVSSRLVINFISLHISAEIKPADFSARTIHPAKGIGPGVASPRRRGQNHPIRKVNVDFPEG